MNSRYKGNRQLISQLNPISWWHWLRALRQNPVYLREKGSWGNPNPFYTKLRRYSPFFVIGAILLGFCSASSNLGLYSGASGNDELFIFYCLLCLPGMALSMLTIFGTFMAPALTAPSIGLEMDQGSWDLLRLTPQSTRSILLAKLFGGLARLKIWPVLFVLSLFQGLLITGISFLSGAFSESAIGQWGILLGITTVVRPWLEIFFAAVLGMFVSTWVRSSTMALVGSYSGIVFVKLFNNSVSWAAVGGVVGSSENGLFIGGTAGPPFGYVLLIVGLLVGIAWRANRMVE